MDNKKPTLKQCSKCKDYKPLTSFFVEKSKKCGRQSKCSPCHRMDAKAWREAKAKEAKK